tara:strand:+ start:125 stop:232 length:108 start_codon:yes stop_codon:yes gene_type:complete
MVNAEFVRSCETEHFGNAATSVFSFVAMTRTALAS